MKRWTVICVVLIAASLCLFACGEDEPDGTNNIQGNPDTSTNNDTDGGGVDADAMLPDADGGFDANVDADVGADADTSPDAEDPITELCNGLEPLGTLPGASTIDASGDTAGGTQLVDPSCGTSGQNEVVFEFSVDQPMRINVTLQSQDADDWVLALYRGSCDAPTRIKCKSGKTDVFVAEAGETYYLAVESATAGSDAAFSLALQTTRLSCAPAGSTSCDGTSVTHCESGGMDEVTYQCAYDCESDACGSDTCNNAIEVASSGTQRFSGSYLGYTSNFNFQSRTDCSSSNTGVNTPGQDLVFSLPGLAAGQEVIVDASADNAQNAIFVMKACSAQEPCVAGGLQVDQIMEWTVEDAGDYHVVIDLLDETDGDFDFSITR